MEYSNLILFGTLIIIIGLLLVFMLAKNKPKPKKSSTPAPVTHEVRTETALLLLKIDKRKRTMDEFHHTQITDSHYKLVFQLQNGERLTLNCSATAHRDVPFRKAGELTYRHHRLIRFQTDDLNISDGGHTDKFKL